MLALGRYRVSIASHRDYQRHRRCCIPETMLGTAPIDIQQYA
jgi:hypothetical protein